MAPSSLTAVRTLSSCVGIMIFMNKKGNMRDELKTMEKGGWFNQAFCMTIVICVICRSIITNSYIYEGNQGMCALEN